MKTQTKPTRKPRPSKGKTGAGKVKAVKALKAWARLDINGEMSIDSLFYYKLERDMIHVEIRPITRKVRR